MAEKIRYPQIPSTVWWGLRGILNRTPKAIIDERFLSTHLDVQEAAARAYVGELKSAGLLDDDNKATELALRWRLDDRYAEAIEELLTRSYPESLRQVAPATEGDRAKIIRWFEHEGLGRGAAGNKAATYMLIGSAVPNGSQVRSPAVSSPRGTGKASVEAVTEKVRGRPPERKREQSNDTRSLRPSSSEMLPLNINVQIHISADAGSEQIEAIFSSMRRYLYDQQTD